MPVLKLIIKTLATILIVLISLRVFIIILNRAPGIIVALSIITSGVLLVALSKGSFGAIGLHTKRSISIALTISIVILMGSSAVLIFMK